MKPSFVNQLVPGELITSSFLVQSKEIREKKTGEPYLSLMLGDRTGRVDAKMWDNVTEILDTFDRDDFVKIKGIVQLHQNRPQVTLHKLRKMTDDEVDFSDYFPCSKRNVEEMWVELRAIVSTVKDNHIRALLNAVLDDPQIAAGFRRAPAAKTIHHAFLGGLLEHVLSLCSLSRAVAGNYPGVDLDLLIAGAVLHDVGKVFELTFDRGFGYSDHGQLIGHISMAYRLIGDKVRDIPGFPEPLRTLIEHMVLSHHGCLEFGSPKVPQFAEAMLFHYLDDLDSKMECMRALIANDRQSDSCFTAYSTSLERSVLKKDRFLGTLIEDVEAVTASAPTPKPAPVVSSSPFASALLSALSKD